MRTKEVELDGREDDKANRIRAAANHWLLGNSPPHCPFIVKEVAFDGGAGLWQIVIGSAAATLGNINPAKFEKALEDALNDTFPDETFIATGAQPSKSKRSSVRGI